MLTITRKDLLLTINDNVIPAMGSSDVSVKFVNDTETYAGFLIEPRVGYYVNGCPQSGICEYDTSSNIIKIPAEAFKNKGILVIAIALIDNADSNHIEVTKELALEVTPAPNGTVILPATDTWQTAVDNLVEQLYNQDYKPQFDQIEEDLSSLVEEAENQQSKAKEQQTQIDNAIDIMGDYEIVQDNPTQIRFKKGDGTYGDTVNLGDNLASKSMVNAGYDTYSGNSYSGPASDYGIEIGKARGAYEQVTTNGYQLFDQSKIQTQTQNGVTVTNNKNGTFSFSGTLTSTTPFYTQLSHEETIKIFKAGKIYFKYEGSSKLRLFIQFYYDGKVITTSDGLKISENGDLAEIDCSNYYSKSDFQILYGFSPMTLDSYNGRTAKPIIYQDGNGTWEPFTGGEPAPNPNYPLEPKFFEPKEFVSVGKNLFPEDRLATGTIVGVTFSKYKDEFNKIHYKFTGQPTGNFNIRIIDTLANSGSVPSNLSRTIFKANKPIYIKFDGSFSANMSFHFHYYDNTFKILYSNNILSGQIFIPEKDVTSVFITFSSNRNYNVDFSIMANYGEEPQEYQPYKGMDETPLNIELRSLPNGVADTWKDGTLTHNVASVTFDGSEDESWGQYGSQGGTRFGYFISQNKMQVGSRQKFICNKFKVENRNINDKIWFGVNNNLIYFPYVGTDLNITTIDDWKTYLQSNPITVWYQLATPTTEQLAIPTLTSYYPFTNAWHDSPLQSQITWNVLTGRSAILDGNGDIIQNGYMTPQDNLLINSDFRSGIINQKGQTSYVGNSSGLYGIDMWKLTSGAITLTVNADSITLTNSQAYGVIGMRQCLNKALETNDYVVACNVKSITGTVKYILNSTTQSGSLKQGLNIFNFKGEIENVGFNMEANSKITLEYIKLEKGKYFTGMPAWSETLELLKCYAKYYCFNAQPDITNYRYVFAVQVATNKARMTIDLPTQINKTPSVKVGYLYIVNIASGGWHLVTSVTAINYVANKLTLELQTQDNISSSVNNPVYAMFTKDGYLEADMYDY